jgi:hypothetical protein
MNWIAAFVAQENAAEGAVLGGRVFGFAALRAVVEHIEGRVVRCRLPRRLPRRVRRIRST